MIPELDGFRFADFWLAWILVPLFVLWSSAWLFMALRRRTSRGGGGLLFSNIGALEVLRGSKVSRLRSGVRALRWFVLCLLLVAILRPQTARRHTQVQTEGIDIILVLDTSGSMQALDMDTEQREVTRRRNRLEVAKDVLVQFVAERGNDQLGLVVFGAQAYTQCPLTLDHGVLASLLERVEIGMAGDATAIGSAIGVAVKRLQQSAAKSKVIVLLTDGRSNAGVLAPATAAELAKTLGMKIYSVGVGGHGRAPFLVDSPLGPQLVYEDVEIDEEVLQQISENTGGAYFRAEDETALEAIYDQIDELERTEITTDSYLETEERFAWLVIPALILLLLETALIQGPLRRLP